MLDNHSFTPLSPPCSPRMSAYHSGIDEQTWQDLHFKSNDNWTTSTGDKMALVDSAMPGLALDMHRRPMLRHHKSFPYALNTSGVDIPEPQTPDPSSGPSPHPQTDPNDTSLQLEDTRTQDLPTVSFGGSAPASPVSNLTPSSEKQEKYEECQDLNGLDVGTESIEEEEEEPEKPMTAAELRAQKRKMKRFRLTHNQTRFLMSEFARQAHPDAAHRERLSREIPGLSPRQVQVWFQNRRAKLKRLTSDDRERMMRSRALPDDFDMTQALHSPFGSTSHAMGGAPLTSPSRYTPAFPEGNMIRPLNLDTLRRVPDGSHLSPTGITPQFGGFNFTPPQSVTDAVSPASNHGESPAFNFSPAEQSSPRRSNPFVPPASPATGPSFTSHLQIPRLQLHDRLTRTRSESLASPLRTSMSYSGPDLTGTADSNTNPLHSAPLNNGPQPIPRTESGNVMPYGLGYNQTSIPGFQASARMRSFSTGMPRRIDTLNPQQHFLSPNRTTSSPAITAAPQTATFPNYASSPLGPPPNFGGLMSAPHHVTSFPNSYLRHESSGAGAAGDSFTGMGSVIGEIDDRDDCKEQHHIGRDSISPGHPQGLGIRTNY